MTAETQPPNVPISSTPAAAADGVDRGGAPAISGDLDRPIIPKPSGGAPGKKLALIPLIFLIYFEVSGGPYGAEPAVRAAGPLLALVGFLVFPFIWSIPEALITAELATALPGNGGYVVWADRAFGPFFGSLMGSWKFLSGVINSAAYPVLCADYLARAAPVLSSGAPRDGVIVSFTLLLSLLNYLGLSIVGYTAAALCVASLLPFFLLAGFAVPKLQPGRWVAASGKKDWRLYFNTLFWNLNFWDNASTLAGEVEQPQKTFPRALLVSGILTIVGYFVPLLAGTGALGLPKEAWEDGFFADAAVKRIGKHPIFDLGEELLLECSDSDDSSSAARPSVDRFLRCRLPLRPQPPLRRPLPPGAASSPPAQDPVAPFGGVKQAGREGSKYGMDDSG